MQNRLGMTFWWVALCLGLVSTSGSSFASKRAGPDVNVPTVQSGFDGTMYVRSVPADELGTAGVTEVYQVARDHDLLVDRYPFYLRGTLHLGWSPRAGTWCVVQVEPLRITDDRDWRLAGTLGGLSFHCGGKTIKRYARPELEAMGLVRQVRTLVYKRPNEFMVRGIEQVQNTNDYVLAIDRIAQLDGAGTPVELRLDILTGAPMR